MRVGSKLCPFRRFASGVKVMPSAATTSVASNRIQTFCRHLTPAVSSSAPAAKFTTASVRPFATAAASSSTPESSAGAPYRFAGPTTASDVLALPSDIRDRILTVQEKSGFVPNVFLALASRPDEFRAFMAYHDALMAAKDSSELTKAEREMIVVTTSAANSCQYCVIAHGAVLRVLSKQPLLSDQIAINFRKSSLLSDKQRVMLEFAMKVSQNSHVLADADFDIVKQAGWSDAAARDMVSIPSFFAMSNRLANSLSIKPNAEFYNMGRTAPAAGADKKADSKVAAVPAATALQYPGAVVDTGSALVKRWSDAQTGVTTLCLNAPAKRNALSVELMSALKQQFEACAKDKSVRVIVLAAAGNVFSSGHDLKQMHATGYGSAASPPAAVEANVHAVFKLCAELMESILTCPQPVIAAVHGIATAAGCQLVATCDLAIAVAEAKFATPGVNIGLFCSTPLVALSRNVPNKQAMEMLLTGDMISADRAREIGLINRVVPNSDELHRAVYKLAASIASKSGAVVGLGKRAFYQQLTMSVPDAYVHTAKVMTQNLVAVGDAREGISAFVEKRHPHWKHN